MNIGKELLDGIYTDIKIIQSLVDPIQKPSNASDLSAIVTKYYVICAASFFESKIKDILSLVLEYKDDELIFEFISRKALERQYHSLFNWNSGTASSFFSLFGPKLQEHAGKLLKETPELNDCVKNFLWLGSKRNILAHNNLGVQSIDNTIEEVKQKFDSAVKFVEWLPVLFQSYKEKASN